MPDRPTVTLVAHGIHDDGGMERAFFELVRRAHERYRFVVIASDLDERLRDVVEWRRVRVPPRPIPLKVAVFAVLAGLRLARMPRSVVHTMGAVVPNRADVATVQFCWAGFRERTGRIGTPARTLPRVVNNLLTAVLSRSLEAWCYRRSRVQVLGAVSEGVARELHDHYAGVPVAITPNGVDVRRFAPNDAEREALRAEQGVEADEVVLLFVGGDWERKGLAIVIDAAARAGIDARLWVVGRGDAEEYGERARRCGVRATFFGERSDAERWYAAADVFVLPTLYETFSLAAYEAAAAGLPVVATRVSGIDELLAGGGAGILVERSVESVSAALATLAGDAALRRSLGSEGRRRATSFDWSSSVDAVVAVYEELVA
jgi:glycosyltransferase involved in cell wall biosynthesis